MVHHVYIYIYAVLCNMFPLYSRTIWRRSWRRHLRSICRKHQFFWMFSSAFLSPKSQEGLGKKGRRIHAGWRTHRRSGQVFLGSLALGDSWPASHWIAGYRPCNPWCCLFEVPFHSQGLYGVFFWCVILARKEIFQLSCLCFNYAGSGSVGCSEKRA